MRDGTTRSEYREAMLRGASLAWEERWDAAAAAYRRALAARPDDPAAERQLALALSHVPRDITSGKASFTHTAAPSISAGPRTTGPAAAQGMNGTVLGRTASAHVHELSELPRELVRSVVETLQMIERDQAAGRYRAAFDSAFELLQRVPAFVPLHILLAELYTETGQWRAARDKLAAVEAAYAARATGQHTKAAA